MLSLEKFPTASLNYLLNHTDAVLFSILLKFSERHLKIHFCFKKKSDYHVVDIVYSEYTENIRFFMIFLLLVITPL